MSTQEIIRELTKLNRDELAQVDLKLHELLEEKIRTGGRSWGEALLEVAGTVEGLPPDYAENHDRSATDNFREFLVSSHNLLARSSRSGISAIK